MIFGVDIGGAHIKLTQLAEIDENLEVKFACQSFSEKGEMIDKLLSFITRPDLVIITQTLCANRYLFSSIKEGTEYIIDVTEKIFGEKVKYIGLPCKLHMPSEAKRHYLKVAGRNWIATCYLASSYLGLFENGLVIDCGTNSTDIVPLHDSRPVTLDEDDRVYTRLKTGELLWSGLYFTHIPSISHTIILDDEEFQVKPTTRATSYDIYVVLGMISPENIAAKYSIWRRDMTFEASVGRMLDVISADRDLLSVNDAQKIAQFLAEKQRINTEKAIRKVFSTAKEKYGTEKIAAIAGAGKDIILCRALKNLGFEEIIDIEKAASEKLIIRDFEINCETSLGCALMGLQAIRKGI